MKSRVVVRSFYEDPYIDFFVDYYMTIGFDNIVILKADNTPYKPPEDYKDKVLVVHVKNEGNDILRKHIRYFLDKTYDWVLNIDMDEFLVIDFDKYKGGINDFLENYPKELVEKKILQDSDQCQQIRFRWLCIHKLDNKDLTFPELLNNYNKYAFNYIKTIGKTNHLNNKNINAHYFFSNKLKNPIIVNNPNAKIKEKEYGLLLDDRVRNILSHNKTFLKNKSENLKNGFILHVHIRSLNNVLMKSLVTQLRNNKKITSISSFNQVLNDFKLSNNNDYNSIYHKFLSHVNIKYYLMNKIQNKHNQVKKFIDENKE